MAPRSRLAACFSRLGRESGRRRCMGSRRAGLRSSTSPSASHASLDERDRDRAPPRRLSGRGRGCHRISGRGWSRADVPAAPPARSGSRASPTRPRAAEAPASGGSAPDRTARSVGGGGTQPRWRWRASSVSHTQTPSQVDDGDVRWSRRRLHAQGAELGPACRAQTEATDPGLPFPLVPSGSPPGLLREAGQRGVRSRPALRGLELGERERAGLSGPQDAEHLDRRAGPARVGHDRHPLE